jgi:hypothetical protein
MAIPFPVINYALISGTNMVIIPEGLSPINMIANPQMAGGLKG